MIEKNFLETKENIFIYNMIENNEIKNLIEYKKIDNKIIYNIDNKISLKEYLLGDISYEKFSKILVKIINLLIYFEKYCIEQKFIYLVEDLIFIDNQNEIYFLINYIDENKYNFTNFYKKLILSTNFELINDLIYLFEINNYLNKYKCNLNEVLKILNKKNRQVENTDKFIREDIKKEKPKFNLKSLFSKNKDEILIKENRI